MSVTIQMETSPRHVLQRVFEQPQLPADAKGRIRTVANPTGDGQLEELANNEG